jgi:hypothetical protein
VPAATLYLHIDQINGVGGPWTLEIGDLGGDLGGFGITNEDVCMCVGGALVVVSFGSLNWCQGSLRGFKVLVSLV